MAISGVQLREIALGLPEAEERETWSEATFRVHDKIFVMLGQGETEASVRTSPTEQAMLVGSAPEVFSVAPYVGRFGWVKVDLSKVDAAEMRGLIVDAWLRTAPKRVVARYQAQ